MSANTLSTLAVSAVIIAIGPQYAQTQAQETTENPEGGRDADHRPPRPDLSEAAATLGITEEDLHAALRASGGPPPDLAIAAKALGISEDELKAVLPEPPRRGRRP
ncbi:MAG: hypothetical protein AAFV59_17435 [Pseudomonadota bacterium]